MGIKPSLWYPIQLSPLLDGNLPWSKWAIKSTLPWINILGRLRPGMSRKNAAAELDLIFQQKLAEMDPRRIGFTKGKKPQDLLEQKIVLEKAGTGYAGLRSVYRGPIYLLMATVGLMQLIACATVGGLLLARGAARRYEFVLRSALGASRSRLIGQLMAESLLLSVLSGIGGFIMAEAGIRFLASYVGGIDLWVDWRVLVFVMATTVLTGVGFGLAPAVRLSSPQLTDSLKDRRTGGGQRLIFSLVVFQIGFAFLLLSVAGLFARTLRNVTAIDTGFQRQRRQLFELSVPSSYQPDRRLSLNRRIEAAIGALPGVESVSSYQGLNVLGEIAIVEPFTVSGYIPSRDEELNAGIAVIGPGFFRTMGIPLLRGRDFGSKDEDTPSNEIPAIVISEWSSKKLFGSADPIGKRIKLDKEFEIVGIVKDIKFSGLKEAPNFEFYLSQTQRTLSFRMTFVVRRETVACCH